MVFVALQLLKHVASAETQPHSNTCINRLIKCDQSLKLGLLGPIWLPGFSFAYCSVSVLLTAQFQFQSSPEVTTVTGVSNIM